MNSINYQYHTTKQMVMKTTNLITGRWASGLFHRGLIRHLALFFFTLSFLGSLQLQAQNETIVIESMDACPGQQVVLTVTGYNFHQPLGGFSAKYLYDPVSLSPVLITSPFGGQHNVINQNAGFSGLFLPNTVGNSTNIAWFGLGGWVDTGTVHLFDLVYTFNGGTGTVVFDQTPGSNTIAYGDGNDVTIIEVPSTIGESGRIINQPTDQTVNENDPASFNLAAPDAIGFQWQVRNGSNWISLSNNAPYSGVTTNTLSISAATLAMNASEYRCLVTGPCVKNSFTSDTVVLNVSSSCNNAVANAGPNRTMCSSDANITFTASALDYDSVLWVSSGDGSIANAKTLTPTYTPGPNDISGMTVTLTLTAYATPPCTDGTDQMNITIMPAVSGNAGSDESTCQGVSFNLSNSATPPTASVFNGGILWTENGTGSLSNANSLTPTYNPGAGELGNVTLTMTVFGVSPCPNVVDQMTLTITPGPQVDAGSDETICAGQAFNLGNSATPPSSGGLIDSLRWNHMGTGSLSGATTLTPTYTPGAGETGAVTLILTGYGGGCPEAYSLMTLTLVNAPTATLSGGAALCPGEDTDLSIDFTGTAPWTFVYAINGTDQAPITTSSNPYTLNVSPAASTTYTLSSVEDAACPGTVSGSATVTNAGTPSVSISATANPICDGESTDLTASGASTYVWDNGLGTGASHTVTPAATTTYSVTGTDGNGCTAEASLAITVNPVPAVSASATQNTICEGESTDITASGADSYAWSNGDNTAGITVSPAITTTYTVTGTTNGCTAAASVTITVNPVPTVAITPDADTLCEGESTILTATGADTYIWSSSETTATISVSPAATATYTVTGTANGCSASAQAEVVVNALPVADAGSDQNINTNTSTSLSGSATGGSGSYSYSWSPAAELVDANVQNPTTIALSTTTVFTLLVTDLNTGCESLPVTVTVNVTGAALSVDATANPDVLCLGDTTWLNAIAAGGSGSYMYSWTSNPAGFTSSIANPWDLPSVTTTYYVQVDDGVKVLVEDSVTVVVNNLPNVMITADTNAICEGDSLVLTASGADDYEWNTGATTASITVNPTVTATYSVTGSTINGCLASASFLLTVNPLPFVEITASEEDICEGASTDLTATGAANYAWSTADITPMITVSPTTNTLYSVTGTDAQGCSASTNINITVHSLPTVDITATDATLCEGESTDLTASGADSYEWNTTETTSTITVSPLATASYQVTGTDVNGCQNTSEISITVNALPSLTVNATEMEVCEGESSDLSVSGADTYEWSTTETTANITVTPLTTTTYQVTGTDINGCQNTAEITITVNALPVVSISASADSICEGDNTTLTASGADTYEWNTGELTAAITVNPATTTTYSLTVTDLNGCIATGDIEVYVFGLPLVSLNATDMEICAGESTDITASGAATYAWSNGGNTAAINVSPVATSTYTVTGTDANGCVQTANITITVNPLPVADAGIDQLIPFNSSTTLSGSASAGSGNYAYAWSPAASLVDANVQNPTTIALVNTAVFSLTVTDVTTQCISAPASVTVNVSGAPLNLSVSATPDIICTGDNSQLEALATGGSGSYTYSWTSNPAGFTSAIHNPMVSPLVTTTYYVVVDDGAKALLSDSVTVTVNDPATAFAGTDTTVCEGNNITIADASASNAQGISWTHNGSGTLTGATTLSPTYQPAAGETGMITLTLTATSNAPCADATDQVIITINPLPLITLNPVDATVVEPNPANFSVVATGATSYQWQVSTDGGLNWTEVVNDTLYSGATTASLQLASTHILMNGHLYKCVVSAQDCEVVSAEAQLNVSASGATIVTTAGSAQACSGDTLVIPINVENFIDVASASLVLEFDPAVLTFLNAQNLNASMALMNPFLVNASANSVLLSWFSVSPANIGTALLAEYVFVYHGGSSNLSWDLSTSGNCEYTDLLSNVLPATFINGSVSAASAAPVIAAQPVDANILDGGNASFMVTATGADTYQWQVRIGSGSWNNLSDNALYSGTNTATLSLTGATLMENFYEFRCIVGESTCGLNTISDAATLFVSPAGPVLTSAGIVDACPGDVILFPVNVANMSTVASISLTLGFNPAVLTYMNIQNLNPLLSASAPLINASGGNFFFSWFSIVPVSLPSGKLFDIEFTYHGGSSALIWDTLTAGNCEYTDFNALLLPAAYTDGAVDQLSFAPVVTSPPADAAVLDGDTAYFSVAATGADAYQWQISTNGGTTWTDLADDAVYQGSTAANLQVNGANLMMNFHLFRCILTENVCNLSSTSAAAELTVSPAGPVITTAGDVTACPGDQVNVPVNVENMSTVSSISLTLGYDPAVLSYSGITNVNAQLAGGTAFANATAGSFAFSWFSLTPAYISNDILFEITFTYLGGYTDLSWDLITTGACEYNDVNALTLPANYTDGSVDAASSAPVVTSQPADITVSTQDPASFNISATGADAYQWQMSSNGGISWVDLADGADYSGTTSNSLSVSTATLFMTGNQFRCILTESLCGLEQISDAATLTVNAIPATTSVGNALACVGDTVVIPVDVIDLYDVATVSLTIDFDPLVLNYLYSQNIDPALSGTPLINASAGSVKFSWFSLAPANVGSTTLFELVFIYQGGYTDLSWDLATPGNTEYGDINTNPIPSTYTDGSVSFAGVAAVITVQPTNVTSYVGFTAAFDVMATGATAYQWQLSTDGGLSWTDLADNAMYAGAMTANLQISGLILSMDGYQYRCMVSGTCDVTTPSDAASLTVMSQPPIVTILGDVAECQGGLLVPVIAEDFNNVAVISLGLNFDPALLQYVGYQNVHPALGGAFFMINAAGSNIFISWFSFAPANIGNDTLFELVFNGITAGSAPITFNTTTPGVCQYTDPTSTILLANFIDGNVSVYPNPSPVISGTQNVCEGASSTYAVAANAGHSYQWTISGGTITGGQNSAQITVNWPAAGSGQLQVLETIDSTGCFAQSNAYNVTINALPTPLIAGPDSLCEGESGQVYNTPLNPGSAYLWTISGGSIVSGQNTNSVVVDWGAAGTGSLTVSETILASNCAANASFTVILSPLPTPVISGLNSVCAFDANVVYGTPDVPGHDYTWTISGGTITAGHQTASITVDWGTDGTGMLELTETDPQTGCQQTVSFAVTVNPLPTPAISGADSVCELESGVVYSTSLNAGSNYFWTITGGSIISGQNTHSIVVDWGSAGSGTLMVSETIAATQCNAEANFSVAISPLPTPVITGVDEVCAFASNLVYSVTDVPGHQYSWTISGGTITGGAQTAVITVDWGTDGIGTLDVIETDPITGCQQTASFTVLINALPMPVISGPDSVCENESGQVYATAQNAGSDYLWTISGGMIVSGQNTHSIVVDWGTAGTGTLELTETIQATTCQNTDNYAVVIHPLPVPVIAGPDTVCENESGQVYTTQANAGHSYQWNVTGGTLVSGQGTASITVDWGLAGMGTVDLTETIDASNCSASASFSVTINILPAPQITGIDSVCEFFTGATYTINANAGSSYAWSVVGGTITSGQNTAQVTIDWNTAGTGTVSVTETIQNGCQASGTLDVTILPQPAPVITGSTAVCAFDAGVIYTTTHLAGNTYLWNVSGGSIVQGIGTNAITVDWGAAGTGTVDVNVTTDDGCTADAMTLTVSIEALPLEYNVTGGGSFCAGTGGLDVGLDSSEVGVNYTLVRDGSLTSTMLSGTGAALNFGPQTTGGDYAVYAENSVTTCGMMMNGTVNITVIPVPSIITQPANVTVDEGSDAIFTVVAANATGYQWQLSLNNGTSWNNLGNGASFSGVTTDSLIVHNTDLSMTGQRFRVVVSGQCTPNATSNAATLTVNPIITTYMGNVTACAGEFIVPVTVENFINVASISLTIDIDTSLLTFITYQNLNPALSTGFPLVNLLGDQIKFSYFSIFPATIGNGLLLELRFSSDGGFSALNFDTQIAGNCEYNQLTGAAYTSIFVNGSADIQPLPMAFNATGGGSYCDGGNGISIGLDGSETGIDYVLYLDGVATATMLSGTGNPLDFGMQTAAGTYTVYAMDTALGCSEWMNGQADIEVLAAPIVFNVTGGGTLCAGDAGFNIGLDGSDAGVSYTLYVDGTASTQVLPGTGNALDFGVFDVAGTYTISAINDTTQCFADMAGSAVIVVNPLPLTFNVTGGGSFCDNGQGVDVGLDGSENGIEYVLYIDGIATTQVLTGTGTALSFGSQSVTGTYTVMANNLVTSCFQTMAGNAVVNLYPNPIVFNVSGGGTLCEGEAGYPVLLDSSEVNVSYTLYLDGNATTQSLAGTGSALSFGNQTLAGIYTVMATENTNGCSLMMSGTAELIVHPLPLVFNVVGGGPYCDGSNGIAVGLDGSETGIEYALYLDGIATGLSLTGTGSAIDFGLQMATGSYTVMAQNTLTACENTMSGSTTVSVSPLPSAYAGGFTIICDGEHTLLNASVSGGTAPYTYAWSPATGLDNPMTLNPTASPTATTYYTLVVTDSIGCIAVDTAIVVVNPSPMVDAGLDKTIMSGTATFLNGTVSGGTMPYTINWTPGASLNDSTALVPIASPQVTTTYTLVVSDANGCYGEDQVTITVNPTPPGYNLFGQVTYSNDVMTPLNNVDVYLEDGLTLFDTTQTDPLGNYLFTGLSDGSYTTAATTQKAFGGVNALDALLIAQQFQGTANLTGLRLAAADLDGNMVPNANDALLALQRAAGIISTYPIMKDWLFEDVNVSISGGDVISSFQGICYGDVNGSYLPGFKAEGNTALAENGILNLSAGQVIRIPIYAAQAMEAAALSLQFTMPAGLSVDGAEMARSAGTYVFNSEMGLNKLEWYSLESQMWREGEVLMYLQLRVNQSYAGGPILLENSSIAGDIHSNVLGIPALAAPKLVLEQSDAQFSLSYNYPNPFSDYTVIRYHLPEAAHVSLSVFNMLGEQVVLLTDGMLEAGEYQVQLGANQLAPGTYFYRIVATASGQTYTQTRKMIVTR